MRSRRSASPTGSRSRSSASAGRPDARRSSPSPSPPGGRCSSCTAATWRSPTSASPPKGRPARSIGSCLRMASWPSGIAGSAIPPPAGPRPASAPMIAFVAKGTAPIAPRVGPLVKETDRPTARLVESLIWTAGDAISAEVGRGAVDLENCLIISGGPAFTLLPARRLPRQVRGRPVLERCTIADDKTSVLLGPWPATPRVRPAPGWSRPGGAPSPGRRPPEGPGPCSRSIPTRWPGASCSGSRASTPTIASTSSPRPALQPANLPSSDVKKQWIDLWGAEHTQGDKGPTPRRNETVLRYKDREKPKPGKVVPAALERRQEGDRLRGRLQGPADYPRVVADSPVEGPRPK